VTPPSSRLCVAAVCAVLFAVLLALVATAWAPLMRFDQAAEGYLDNHASGHGALVDVARDVSSTGRPLVFEAAATVLIVVVLFERRVRAACALAVALGSEMLLGHFIKVLVDRPRPVVAVPITLTGGSSFPSSHALTSATVVTAAIVICSSGSGRGRRWVSAVGAVLVAGIGLSRMLLAVHFPSDVAAGWLLGVAIALTSATIAPRETPESSTSVRGTRDVGSDNIDVKALSSTVTGTGRRCRRPDAH
jgi:membrane-associated phospholipid phosphatase